MPVHSAPHDRSFFQMINFYIAIGVVIFGVWQLEYFLALLGLGVGIIYWFTTPRNYFILSDRLVVLYGQPRMLAVSFDSVLDVNVVRVPLTTGIFIRRVNRPGVIIRPKEMETFVDQLWSALEAYGAPAIQNRAAYEGDPSDGPMSDDDHAPDAVLPPDEDARANDSQPPADAPSSER